MELIFATGNRHKVLEVQQLLSKLELENPYVIKTLSEVDFDEDIPETADSFFGNAAIKAKTVYESMGIPCFGEDSGLVVPSLGGEPGVYSARYAGVGKSDRDNYLRLLDRMKDIDNRAAHFHTSLVFFDGHDLHHFEGQVHGSVLREAQGKGGFGYDPIFRPSGYDTTFATMASSEKLKISHRSRAMMKFISFLEGYAGQR